MENYNKIFNEYILKNDEAGIKPKLLLHACCGPCLSSVIEKVLPHFDTTVFYYNPNIMPNEEFIKRFDSLKLLLSYFPDVKLITGEWNNDEYLRAVKGLEKEKEGGARCSKCFELRLNETAKLARNFDCFTTTLTVSPHKNADVVNQIGKAAAKIYGSNYLPSDFKKENGFLRSIELSKKYGLYRQNYCGCSFARTEE